MLCCMGRGSQEPLPVNLGISFPIRTMRFSNFQMKPFDPLCGLCSRVASTMRFLLDLAIGRGDKRDLGSTLSGFWSFPACSGAPTGVQPLLLISLCVCFDNSW